MEGRKLLWLNLWYRLNVILFTGGSSSWGLNRLNRFGLVAIGRYALLVFVPYFRATSVFGFALLLNIILQMWSGFLLALYYVPDPSFVMTFREEYFNEIWWYPHVYKIHVIGVDTIFVLSYLHILKKLYLKNFALGDVDGWFTGAYAFMFYHIVVFLGITLSTNHLGDVTVTIAANIFWSVLLRWHKAYSIFFTNKHLNVDQLTRFMIAHYVAAWYYTYLVQLHVMFIHEMWDPDANQSAQQDATSPKLAWLFDALKKEVLTMFAFYKFMGVLFLLLGHPDTRVVNYSFFEQWAETEMEDINFFIVAPHWYFRAHMGLLTVCAQPYEGLAWLVGFYAFLSFMPHAYRLINGAADASRRAETSALRQTPVQQAAYVLFFASLIYVGGTLPCGRFYYEGVEGFFGSSVLRLSYQYLYLYMGLIAHVTDALERWYQTLPSRLLLLTQVRALFHRAAEWGNTGPALVGHDEFGFPLFAEPETWAQWYQRRDTQVRHALALAYAGLTSRFRPLSSQEEGDKAKP